MGVTGCAIFALCKVTGKTSVLPVWTLVVEPRVGRDLGGPMGRIGGSVTVLRQGGKSCHRAVPFSTTALGWLPLEAALRGVGCISRSRRCELWGKSYEELRLLQ